MNTISASFEDNRPLNSGTTSLRSPPDDVVSAVQPLQRSRPRILAPGRNCWRIANAEAVLSLIDAADYFGRLDDALRRAQRSIIIIGWDFDGRIKLCPDHEDCLPLGDLLRSLVEAKPELQVHILVWSVAVIHAPGAPLPLLLGAPWQDHPRITLRLDTEHPIYAAHHQKIVCIDDTLAFTGGIDLTLRRWDTCRHEEADSHRLSPDGTTYSPVHDVQVMLKGDAARALAEVARQRWRVATDEILPPVVGNRDLWPSGHQPEFVDVPVAVARTAPAWRDNPSIREVAALTDDAISAARRWIYIEAQYLTASRVVKLLESSLADAQGPEIVIVLTRSSHGLMERLVMGANRDRMVRRLRQADRYDRLRVWYPVVPGSDGDCEVLVHAKVLIVDDTFVRIGSSNLNNRSIGLDTECDVSIEAADESTCRGIAGIRNRLLAEHLGVKPEAIAAAVASEGSLVHAIDRLNTNARALRALDDPDPDGPTRSFLGTRLLDPTRPFEPGWFLRRKRFRPRHPPR
jgi:phosphatidylserine/phosphatidylglycerophosphate/cardiolipin synthase-like enzyme